MKTIKLKHANHQYEDLVTTIPLALSLTFSCCTTDPCCLSESQVFLGRKNTRRGSTGVVRSKSGGYKILVNISGESNRLIIWWLISG